ncbi:unnamed protein product [Discosporangium mesarthrocarpum]
MKKTGVYHMDAIKAFLQSPIGPYEDHVKEPPGFMQNDLKTGEEYVCKLKRSLYRLQNSILKWFNTLIDASRKIGFIPLSNDQCALILRQDSDQIIVTIYVDDNLISRNNPELIAKVKRSLHERYVIKDLGEVTKILCIRIVRDREKGLISLDQKDYAESILERFGMAECNLTYLPREIIPPNDQNRL